VFKFISNIVHAQRNAALLATARADLFALEAKARNIVSHATGGLTRDIGRSLNDISVDITRHLNDAWHGGAREKARELAGDLLHSMHEAERKVLVILHNEVCRPLALIAEETGLAVDEVRTLVKGFVIKGLATFGPATSDEGMAAGSGYTLTDAGQELKARQLAANVVDSAARASVPVTKTPVMA
jgi:hypothetical protein